VQNKALWIVTAYIYNGAVWGFKTFLSAASFSQIYKLLELSVT
jgi:hypothetical protein